MVSVFNIARLLTKFNKTFFVDPLNKFMLLKQCEWPPSTSTNGSVMYDNSVFEMIILPELEYPLICVGVSKSFGGTGLKLELINTNSGNKKYY